MIGPKCTTSILPDPIPAPAQERSVLKYFYPQPPSSPRVSPIFKVQPYWRVRNGLYLHSNSSLQFFYAADGTISFMFLGIDEYAFSPDVTPPLPHPPICASEDDATHEEQRITEVID